MTSVPQTENALPVRGYTEEEIRRRLEGLPRLASLRSISSALQDLLNADYSFTAQIADIIRRDPSLTSRLLRLVNSVFFGVAQKITNIEEAVFYLGLRQIRELALATPVIEDFEQMPKDVKNVDWRLLWQQSIGAALLTRELVSAAGLFYEDDRDYLVGLLHKVGKIAMASVFPEEFALIHQQTYQRSIDVCVAERQVIGWDHTQVGAFYLQRNNLHEEIVEAVAFQNLPSRAGRYTKTAAAIHISNHLLQTVGIRGVERIGVHHVTAVESLPAWRILFREDRSRSSIALASLQHTLKRLPMTLSGMV